MAGMKLDLSAETVEFYKIPSRDSDAGRYVKYAANYGIPAAPKEAFRIFCGNWNRDLDKLSSSLGGGTGGLGEGERHTYNAVSSLSKTYPPGSFEKGRFGDVLFQNPAWLRQAACFPTRRPSGGTLEAPELYGGNLKMPDKLSDAIKWSSLQAKERQEAELEALRKSLAAKAELKGMDAAAWQSQEQAEARPAGPQAEADLGHAPGPEAAPPRAQSEVRSAPKAAAKVKEKAGRSIADKDGELRIAKEERAPQPQAATPPAGPFQAKGKPGDQRRLPQEQDAAGMAEPEPAPQAAPAQAAPRGYAFTPVVSGADLRRYFYAEPIGGTPEFAAIRNSGAPIIINIYNNSRRSVFRMAADALKALPQVFASSAVTFYKGVTEAAAGRAADKQAMIPQIGYSRSVASALSEIIDRRVDMRMDAIQKAIGGAILGERAQDSLAAQASAQRGAGGMGR